VADGQSGHKDDECFHSCEGCSTVNLQQQ
jgi:hypothetical protein